MQTIADILATIGTFILSVGFILAMGIVLVTIFILLGLPVLVCVLPIMAVMGLIGWIFGRDGNK